MRCGAGGDENPSAHPAFCLGPDRLREAWQRQKLMWKLSMIEALEQMRREAPYSNVLIAAFGRLHCLTAGTTSHLKCRSLSIF
jgi:hypothetical protein